MSTRIGDLSLQEFFIGPEAIRIEDCECEERDGNVGSLKEYLCDGPGEWVYPVEHFDGPEEDTACVAYRDRVVARFESELRNAANGQAWTDHRYYRPDVHDENISVLLMSMYNFKTYSDPHREPAVDVFTPDVIFDLLYEVMSSEWKQEGVFGLHCQTLLKHGRQRVDWYGTCVRGDLVRGMRNRGLGSLGLVDDY